MNRSVDYGLERRLKELDPGLHARFTDTVFAMQHALFRYQLLFPEFTDHTWLHSLSVIDFCNRLIGPVQMEQLNADPADAVVFGDSRNDLSMFRGPWTKVAMGNAIPELKELADFVTADVADDGIYKACEALNLFG